MKKLTHASVVLFCCFVPMLSCDTDEKKDLLPNSNVVLTESQVTETSLHLGILRYQAVTRSESITSFLVDAIPVQINQTRLNLKGKIFSISTTADEHEISAELFNKKYHLTVNRVLKKGSLATGGVQIPLTNLNIAHLNNDDQLSLLVLISVLDDRTNFGGIRLTGERLKNLKMPVSYVTMSAGLSQNSAGSNLDEYNKGSEGNLTTHGCVKNGRDFGCVLGETFCIAVDHWICDSNPGFNIS